ncbi:MAG: enoyl-CoA hydratase [Actinobacteria bacterium]|nr:enoyl-CoA hydratase [Actinomycetota bacterium]
MVEGASVESPLSVEVRSNVMILTMTRPSRRNAVNLDMLHAFANAFDEARAKSIRVILLTGVAPSFSAGADLAGVKEDDFQDALHGVLTSFVDPSVVTVAYVNGHALGAGAQLMAACDVRMAAPTAVVGIPAAKLGLVVNHWTIERLVREFSWPIARNMLLTAATYDASALHSSGSIHRLGTLDEAISWATEIAELAPLTQYGHKLALESSAGNPDVDELVIAARRRALDSDDVTEGRAAFSEKRKPKFTGS